MPRYIIWKVHFSTTEKKGCESCKERIKYDPGAGGKKKAVNRNSPWKAQTLELVDKSLNKLFWICLKTLLKISKVLKETGRVYFTKRRISIKNRNYF